MQTPERARNGRQPDYEDFVIGETVPFGSMSVSRDDIVRYARAFDPQPFHLSEELARDTNVGRLIASGYHTCCIMMRLLADHLLGGPDALGSPGVDEVKFLKPVLPGDILSGRCKTLDKRALRSKPGVGIVHLELELANAHGESVMRWNVKAFRRMREAVASPMGGA
jgi:acyl dehydratase